MNNFFKKIEYPYINLEIFSIYFINDYIQKPYKT